MPDGGLTVMTSAFVENAPSAGPFIHNHSSTHRIISTEKIRRQLGCRDKGDPEEAMRRTVRWQAEHLPGTDDAAARLQDPFDYAGEDALIAATEPCAAEVGRIEWAQAPGWSFGYYGPRENPGGRRGSLRG